MITGNMELLMDRHGWDFVDELGSRYNKVVKLTGQLGVSGFPSQYPCILIEISSQSRVLYVFDPLVLHHIFVKDGDSFDLPEWAIE